ncbi:MAG: hypothetical protein ABSF10_04460 [Verrucomicrobiota bacterium]|jgi:hypothetical protein
MTSSKAKALSNHEIVTLAVYLLGGDSKRIDTEDIAVKANELAPGRFAWRKYPNQINIENVRTFLSDAKKPKNGAYLIGAGKDGWILTGAGLTFATSRVKGLGGVDLSRKALSPKERNWERRERERMLSSDAFAKFSANQIDTISTQEAESFFRVDAYVTGEARKEKILRARNRFREDSELGPLIKLLESKLSKGE